MNMKIKLNNIVTTLLFLFFSIIFTDAENNTWKPNSSFFKDCPKSIQEELEKYLVSPRDEDLIITNKYERVIKEFNIWLQKTLSPEYLPSLEDIKKQIKLYPTKKTNRGQDLAFLMVNKTNFTMQIVQSGGNTKGAMFVVFYKKNRWLVKS